MGRIRVHRAYIMPMPKRTGAACVVTTMPHYKGRVYHSHLLRRSHREGGKARNETLGNLSHLPEPLIAMIRRSLQGETFVPLAVAFTVLRSQPHGHVEVAQRMMERLGIATLIASKPCRERDIVLALIAARIVDPQTKLATTRSRAAPTLADIFGVTESR